MCLAASLKEAERLQCVERLLGEVPRLTTGKAMTFSAKAARKATKIAKGTSK